MRLNDRDKELFRALAKSQIGNDLADYLNRLCDDICDVRTWRKEDTRESVTRASEAIKEHLLSKLVGKKEGSKQNIDFT